MFIGYLGEIPFSVSNNKVQTFDEYNRSASGRWARHEIIGDKPVMEYLGPDTETISLKMFLRQDLGADPEALLEQLRDYRDEGTPIPLILNNWLVNNNNWVVDSIDEQVSYWSSTGEITAVNVQVTLQEYPE